MSEEEQLPVEIRETLVASFEATARRCRDFCAKAAQAQCDDEESGDEESGDQQSRGESDAPASVEEEDAHSLAARWHASMLKPLSRAAKYFKAVERILLAEPHAYIACEYRDMDMLAQSVQADAAGEQAPLAELGVVGAYAQCSPGDKKVLWLFVCELNRLAHAIASFEPQRAPSRDEIHRNIQQRREQRRQDGGGGLGHAFHASILALAQAARSPEMASRLEQITAEQQSEILERWKALPIDASCDDVEALCGVDWAGVLGDEDGECVHAALRDDGARDAVIGAIQQITSYCKVQAHIPSQMMGRIEQYAQQLAGDITSGAKTLADLDLSRIGEEVLSGCDPDDMNALAGNIGDLLPTLASMKSKLPDM